MCFEQMRVIDSENHNKMREKKSHYIRFRHGHSLLNYSRIYFADDIIQLLFGFAIKMNSKVLLLFEIGSLIFAFLA